MILLINKQKRLKRKIRVYSVAYIKHLNQVKQLLIKTSYQHLTVLQPFFIKCFVIISSYSFRNYTSKENTFDRDTIFRLPLFNLVFGLHVSDFMIINNQEISKVFSNFCQNLLYFYHRKKVYKFVPTLILYFRSIRTNT